jgi:hypothetical protein
MMHVHLLTILLRIGFRLNTSFCVCHMMSPGTRKTHFYFPAVSHTVAGSTPCLRGIRTNNVSGDRYS